MLRSLTDHQLIKQTPLGTIKAPQILQAVLRLLLTFSLHQTKSLSCSGFPLKKKLGDSMFL